MHSLVPVDQKLKRRGRPCASERYNNELLEKRLTSMINSDDEFTKSNIMPFIVKRQRRVRANNRERNRMQNLNEALNVLKEHLPLEFLMSEFSSDLDNSVSSDSKRQKKKSGEEKLTKIDTLRLATRYIGLLTELLNQDNDSIRSTSHSSESNSNSPVINPWSMMSQPNDMQFYPRQDRNYQNFSLNSNGSYLNSVYSNNHTQNGFYHQENHSLNNVDSTLANFKYY
ncbi:neurogenin-2 [Brachionus plicatilis]|uniref:Neurogenin-2 n=1 Tax=Brachionus plicatilis TaxID=10195 RepID=A0A3M7QGJ4_BRAPC|nr:neurogenin-2 [Brachionus plicatilis]